MRDENGDANSNVYLNEVNASNWRQCIALQVTEEQTRFMSTNVFSLAQSKFETNRIPCAIYNSGNTMVGFTMYNETPLLSGDFRISRFMIDRHSQGMGYGLTAAKLVIDRLNDIPDCSQILLDHHPENNQASEFWKKLGFVPHGMLGTNIELCLML